MAVDSDEVRSRPEELLDAGAHDRLDTMRHSAAHMMAAAVLELFPGAKLGIGPAIKDGFYYDFDLPRALAPADLEAIEAKMREQIKAALRFERSELPRDEALARLADTGQDYKVEIIRDLPAEESETVSFYQHGAFSDLCRGPHLESTAALGPFKLLSSAAAYWRGDESRPMLQRVYGTVWETKDELDRYLWRLEEARARDHRKVGRELDLFTFHPESPAAPFWHPRGMALWRALEDWSLQVRRDGGFAEVRTPSLVRKELWEQSGHWDLLPGQHVRPRRLGPYLRPEADELPGGDPRLQDPISLVPRPADALRRLQPPLPEGAHGRLGRPLPGAAAHPGRLPCLLPRRPGDRGDRPRSPSCRSAVRAVRLLADLQARHAAGEEARQR